MATKKIAEVLKIGIQKPIIKEMGVRIVGLTPIIFHKFSEKAKKQMRDKQAKKATQGRETREPEKEYLSSFYYTADGYIAFKAGAIKQAIVGAARSIDGVTMAELRGTLSVIGDLDDLIPVLVDDTRVKPTKIKFTDGEGREDIFGIDTKNPNIVMREDTVTVGMGSADLRYRGQVSNWEMAFVVRFLENKISPEQVLNLIQYAGFSCGLAEWRPERNGNYGTFEVKATSEEALTK